MKCGGLHHNYYKQLWSRSQPGTFETQSISWLLAAALPAPKLAFLASLAATPGELGSHNGGHSFPTAWLSPPITQAVARGLPRRGSRHQWPGGYHAGAAVTLVTACVCMCARERISGCITKIEDQGRFDAFTGLWRRRSCVLSARMVSVTSA